MPLEEKTPQFIDTLQTEPFRPRDRIYIDVLRLPGTAGPTKFGAFRRQNRNDRSYSLCNPSHHELAANNWKDRLNIIKGYRSAARRR